MADRSRRGGKALRFAVGGALLIAPTLGCGHEAAPEPDEELHINVPPDPETDPHPNPGPSDYEAAGSGQDPSQRPIMPVPNPGEPDPSEPDQPTANE